jgi:hypothetical protein
MTKKSEIYSEEEAQRRFEAFVKAALNTPPENTLALAFTGHDHVWRNEQRALYERAVAELISGGDCKGSGSWASARFPRVTPSLEQLRECDPASPITRVGVFSFTSCLSCLMSPADQSLPSFGGVLANSGLL